MRHWLGALALASMMFIGGTQLVAQKKEAIPHNQSEPPGPALSPLEAIKKMQVPPGFSVELVAAEPDVVNPVAMAIDEKGRFWITESLEYPRRSPGKGKDRVKILEDTDGDGKVDKVTIFAEGLNIPSGIAVGHGGAWVANAPDILFYPIGPDGKAGKPEVVVTGFGRDDTHELPNSLTWGPDGWLYGLNGVFNRSVVKQNGKTFDFTCALFRIHPKTKEFQLFAEGTSNPWGVAFDPEGSAFVSACVIDHLWHLTETGYYHRQGGPYPPFTWKIESIVKHKHQKAAYCGITYFDSDAYPAEFRDKLYMGNIHGNCINSDELTRDGSTYFGRLRPDFLTANDAWFMPVVQKTGPDGSLYILDWYDRYHCYQDANRDPAGIDRLRGRLYRVRYKDTARPGSFDLTKETDDQLLERLQSPNVYFRDLAQRLLAERNAPATRSKLWEFALKSDETPRKARMHALWALAGTGSFEPEQHAKVLAHGDPGFRAWGVRMASNMGAVSPSLVESIAKMSQDTSPDVKLQVAIASRKVKGLAPIETLVAVLENAGSDRLIPHIVWQNLHPLLETEGTRFFTLAGKVNLNNAPAMGAILPRVIDRIMSAKSVSPTSIVALLKTMSESQGNREVAAQVLMTISKRMASGELSGDALAKLRVPLLPALQKFQNNPNLSLAMEATYLAAALKDADSLAVSRKVLGSSDQADGQRLKALSAMILAQDSQLTDAISDLLTNPKNTPAFRGQVLTSLGKLDQPVVAEVVLGQYAKLEPDLQPKAIDLLTERAHWSQRLLDEIRAKKIPSTALNVNQVRKLLATKNAKLTKQVTEVWGLLREGRNPEREKLVFEMRDLVRKTPGDPHKGVEVFKKVCAQCHKMYGEGVDVGPDITANGRSDFEQLLSNVFDPSLVIGAGYQATLVTTAKGQVLTGLLVEDSPQRVVLKLQGGKVETIARGEVDQVAVQKTSMMPEGLEKQLQPREIIDLFAYLTLDRPPTDPKARRIPGSPK